MSVAITSPSLGSASASRSAADGQTTDAASTGIAASRRNTVRLDAGRATSLRADCARLLQVRQGKVWVTRDATVKTATEDIVLGCGESLRVAAGDRIVLEPWDRNGATYSWDIASPAG
jgi:hypothetical protein